MIAYAQGYAFENGEPVEWQMKKLEQAQVSNGDRCTGAYYLEDNKVWFHVVDRNGNEYATEEEPYIDTGIVMWRATDTDLNRALSLPVEQLNDLELRLRTVHEQMTTQPPVKLAYLTGRRANAAQRDAGPLIHAVTEWYDSGDNMAAAVCGAKPGRRSIGWAESHNATAPTCPKCLKKLGHPHA